MVWAAVELVVVAQAGESKKMDDFHPEYDEHLVRVWSVPLKSRWNLVLISWAPRIATCDQILDLKVAILVEHDAWVLHRTDSCFGAEI